MDIATGDAEDAEPSLTDAQRFAQQGGLKGGEARAKSLSAERRAEIAQKAAKARWGKK